MDVDVPDPDPQIAFGGEADPADALPAFQHGIVAKADRAEFQSRAHGLIPRYPLKAPMIEIAGGILLAVLVIVLLPWIIMAALGTLGVALVATVLVIVVAVFVSLWTDVHPAASIAAVVVVACLAFLYHLGEDRARWNRFWRIDKR